MKVALKLESQNLIQSIRLTQAIMEADVSVSIDKRVQKIYDYLARHFKVRYNFDYAKIARVSMSHKEPYVKIGEERRDLLYSHDFIAKVETFWQKRTTQFLFMGFVPPHREPALNEWSDRATIINTNQGRTNNKRYWDVNYYTKMGAAEFVLCPDGGYPWTYRFFEAILSGATPIVQTDVPMYEGFYYQKWNDPEFERKHVQDNLDLAKERLTMDSKLIRKNLF